MLYKFYKNALYIIHTRVKIATAVDAVPLSLPEH